MEESIQLMPKHVCGFIQRVDCSILATGLESKRKRTYRETLLSRCMHVMIGLTLNLRDFIVFLTGKMGEIVKFPKIVRFPKRTESERAHGNFIVLPEIVL